MALTKKHQCVIMYIYDIHIDICYHSISPKLYSFFIFDLENLKYKEVN